MERLCHQSLRPERLADVCDAVVLEVPPPYGQVLAEFIEAEQAEGWMARCEEAGQYVALNAPFIGALAGVLRGVGSSPVLEVCAGDGSLAEALRQHGVEVIATDAHPPAHALGLVEKLPAEEALKRYQPRAVLGSFVPIDSGVDQLVLNSPGMRDYLVLNAWLGGEFGAPCLWNYGGWTRTPLGEVTSWMLSRHDVWLGPDVRPLTHSEAWLLSRTEPAEQKISHHAESSGS